LNVCLKMTRVWVAATVLMEPYPVQVEMVWPFMLNLEMTKKLHSKEFLESVQQILRQNSVSVICVPVQRTGRIGTQVLNVVKKFERVEFASSINDF